MSKKFTLLTALITLIITAGVSFYFFSHSVVSATVVGYKAPTANGKTDTVDAEDTGEPKTEECPLNGEMLTKTQRDKWEKRRPLGVMIENHKEARPQSGISSADVVYEAVAEGGITRTLSIFYCKDAPYVGPVRSARVHFMKMLREYGEYPLYAHVGGANCDEETGSGCENGAKADALGIISKLGWAGYNDMNQFSVPFPVFYRDPDRLPDRATEHTVYSSTQKLWDYAATKRKLTNVDEEGTAWDKTFTKWKFQDDAAKAERGTVKTVNVPFWDQSTGDYGVTWKYDTATNSYLRVNGGVAHMDKNTGKQLSPKNVVVIFAEEAPANDGYPGGHIIYDLAGSGEVLIFQNGQSIKGTWNKKDEESRTQFLDAGGKEVEFVRGQIFVQIIPAENKVTY